MTTKAAGGQTVETITDEEVAALVAETLAETGVDLETLRSYATRGRFDTERQRRAWFLISGLGQA
jgi:hypothetical protein